MNHLGVDCVVGADIGGANLKYASDRGSAHSRAFALWRHPRRLSQAIQEDLSRFAPFQTLAVTMTGELADCFVDRQVGVEQIVRATQSAARDLGIRSITFYGVDGRFHPADAAIEKADVVAAANWHALASFVGTQLMPDGLLVDVGSTTTDLIPIRRGAVATAACSDFDRLAESSLVYVGCRRTPACALVDCLNLNGRRIGVMNELFATMDDVRLILGKRPERPLDNDSADGKPRTQEFAANRLARMIGLDRRQVDLNQARELAIQVYEAGKNRISAAINRFADDRLPVLLCGHGHDMVDVPPVVKTQRLSEALRITETVSDTVSRCAPAYAVARLCARQSQLSKVAP